MRPSRRVSLAALAVAVLAGRISLAQSSAGEAEAHFRLGLAHADARNYPAAVAEFRRAWELGHDPRVLFNVSATLEASEHFAEALETLREFERAAPPALLRRARTELDAAIARLVERVGTVVIAIDAADLEVRVDGALRSTPDARAGLSLSVGPHRVSLRAPGFESREDPVEVTGRAVLVLRDPLRPRQSSVRVEADVDHAEVLVDGRPVATTPMSSPAAVPEGRHGLVVRRAGYTEWRGEVDARGEGALARASLAWTDPISRDAAATVIVRPTEDGASATLDDHAIAVGTPTLVPPGPHRLRVARADFTTETRDVELAPNATSTVDVALSPTPAFRDAWDARVRRTSAIAWTSVGVGGALVLAGAAVLAASWGPYQDHLDAYHRQDEDFAQRCTRNISFTCGALGASRDAALGLVQGDLDVFLASGVLAGVGVAAVAVGAVLHARGPSSSRFAHAPNVSLLPGAGSLALRVMF